VKALDERTDLLEISTTGLDFRCGLIYNELKNIRETVNTLDKWLGKTRESQSEQKTHSELKDTHTRQNRDGPSLNKAPSKSTQTSDREENSTLLPSCDCISLGCSPCLDHGQQITDHGRRILRLEEELLNKKQQAEAAKNNNASNTHNKPRSQPKTSKKLANEKDKPGQGPPSQQGVKGIKRPDFNSTCYINAALQALFDIQEFSEFINASHPNI